jgi:hypothetical protein
MAKKVMRLVDPFTNRMECRVCGGEHWAMIKPQSNGRFRRGAWQCSNGCKLPEETAGAENRGANGSATSRSAR